MTFPYHLSTGETLADKEALAQYVAAQKKRSAGNGYAAKIAAFHLNELQNRIKKE